jgi:Fe-S-cluster-containing dehydrogenase component
MKSADFGTRGQHRVAPHQRVVIKSQKKTDMGPFVRFSCWHCSNPPCAGRCPFGAVVKVTVTNPDGTKTKTGPVWVDPAKCNPSACNQQCLQDCLRGGYPKIGVGNIAGDNKNFKCVMCHPRAGLGGDLPTKATAAEVAAVPEKAHQPTCVMTCPAKAMTYDTRANINAKIKQLGDEAKAQGKTVYVYGDSSMNWISTKAMITAPKADPFVEDHITPMVSGLLSSPFAKAAIVPTLVVGGLMAVSAMRAENEKASVAIEGEV